MRRSLTTALLALGLVAAVAAPALACAGLVAPNGSVRLTRTATLAGYHDGVEHYVTSFRFEGGGGAKFGSIVPLPDVPSKVTRGGDWTLQRLERETAPPEAVPAAGGDASRPPAAPAEELYETEIDGLLITILKGGSRAVGKWAKNEGFSLTPDAPEVLRFYAQRSKIFMAARFVPEKAKKERLEEGDGIPIHLRIPTDNPWVPLRILALGKRPYADVNADVYLLTDDQPALLPTPVQAGSNRGMVLERDEQASDSLLDDLRSDKGMKWIPEEMWLTYLRIEMNARNLTYDLAVDASGAGAPSEQDAYGVQEDGEETEESTESTRLGWIVLPVVGMGLARAVRSRRRR
ncbi:MAG TPA: DUF2330 domain-containing protein [Actinomycetota bacterium]|nr:DUF2330 domain-containing protein [Actinomycetota bacterium]